MQSIVFRTDGNRLHGMGHVMRCLALAEELLQQGFRVTFLLSEESQGLLSWMQRWRMDVMWTKYPSASRADAEQCVEIAKSKETSWLVLDGYHLGTNYQDITQGNGFKTLLIDDCASLSAYHADVILNYNNYATPEMYGNARANQCLLLGTPYVLLRSEFTQSTGRQRSLSEQASRVLVTFGGSDSQNVSSKVVRSLMRAELRGLEAKVVVGPANTNSSVLAREIEGASGRIQCLSEAASIPEVMTWADCAISAAGVTSWELAFMGVPIISISIAENQRRIAQGLEQCGASIDLGSGDDFSENRLVECLENLCRDVKRRKSMSEAGRALVDGLGPARVCRFLQSY